jgi:hypothetical protein
MDQDARHARTASHFSSSAAGTVFLWIAALLVGTSIAGLQGCRQLGEGTDGTASGSREQTSFQDQLPGCWSLRITADGAQRDSLRSWLPEGALPSVIELDTTRLESASSDSVYTARSHGGRPGRSFSGWRYSRGDSIRVQRMGALSGTMLELKPTGQKLVGSVVVFTDARRMGRQGQPLRSGDFRRRGAVEATPIGCPSE